MSNKYKSTTSYFLEPQKTQYDGIFLIGRVLSCDGRHLRWVQHFGTYSGAVEALRLFGHE